MAIKKMVKKITSKIPSFLKPDQGISFSDRYKLRQLQRYTPAQISFFGRPLKVPDVLTFRTSYYEIFKREIYNFSFDSQDMVIIDCGANIGLATIYLKLKYPQSHLIAFEPDPHIYPFLEFNVQSFAFNNVILKNEAISDTDRWLIFTSEGGHSGKITGSSTGQLNVKASRLKSVLESYDQISFLKVDIEGEEVKVIPDIADQLHKVEYLFLEYHSYLTETQSLGELLQIITEAGMRYYIQEAVRKEDPFVKREIFLNMDLILNIFCYR